MKHKTNAMRILDQKKVNYEIHSYVESDAISGIEVADFFGYDYNKVYKTLVTTSKSKQIYVFAIPVDQELDLKKAAKVVGEKNVEMIKAKELLPLTGYIHGGCSPIGMKKQFETIIHESAQEQETICLSAGQIGYQIETSLSELEKVLNYELADIIKDNNILD
ncbi:MAG: Cys-tRNA(Pro) deacylase [Erysipelotrichales bacterium]